MPDPASNIMPIERILDARIELDRVARVPQVGWQTRVMDTLEPIATYHGVSKDDLWDAWFRHNKELFFEVTSGTE